MLKTTLASKIMDEMQRYKKGVSFVEFTRFAGPEANGDRMLCVPDHPNLVLWAGLSSDFIDAFQRPHAEVKVGFIDQSGCFDDI